MCPGEFIFYWKQNFNLINKFQRKTKSRKIDYMNNDCMLYSILLLMHVIWCCPIDDRTRCVWASLTSRAMQYLLISIMFGNVIVCILCLKYLFLGGADGWHFFVVEKNMPASRNDTGVYLFILGIIWMLNNFY